MIQAPKRLAALFVLAVTGVLVAIGLVVQALAGGAGAAVYAMALLALVAVAARWIRRRVRAAAARAAGRTCSCCTGTVHDPVQVV